MLLFMMVEIILKPSLVFTIFEAPPDRDHQDAYDRNILRNPELC